MWLWGTIPFNLTCFLTPVLFPPPLFLRAHARATRLSVTSW